MKKRKLWAHRILSLTLVFMMVFASPAAVWAEDSMAAGSQETGSQQLDSKESADESGNVEELDGVQGEASPSEDIVQQDGVPETKDEGQAEEAQAQESGERSIPAVSTVTESPAASTAEDGRNAINTGITVTMRFDGYGRHLVTPVQVKMPDTYKPFSEYGLTVTNDPGYFTPLHVLAEYCVQTGKNPAAEIDQYEGNINNFMGAGSSYDPSGTFIMYMVNHAASMDLTGGHELRGGDVVVFYDWYWSASSAYVYFPKESYRVQAADPFQVKLNAVSSGMGDSPTPEGADIIVLDEQGNKVDGAGGQIDSSGNAEVCIQSPGNYTLTAERLNAGGFHELNRPYASVSVTGESYTDQQAVEKVLSELTLGDVSAVEGNLTLPVNGDYGTHIDWESQDTDYMDHAGTLKKRPLDENKAVILKAVVSKNGVSQSRDFEVTIKGLSSDFRILEVNPGTITGKKANKNYTVYVKDTTAKLEIKAQPPADSVYTKINNSNFQAGDDVNTVEIALPNEQTVIPVEFFFAGTKCITTITVKKTENPGEPLPDLPNSWGQHFGNADNNAVVSTETPTEPSKLVWESFSGGDGWYAGSPILAGGSMYVARNGKLQKLNPFTGAVEAEAALKSPLNFYSYITYGDGKIFVPLADSSIQCFHASTLESLFLTEAFTGVQALSSVHYSDGMIYTGYTDWMGGGCFAAFETVDRDYTTEDEITAPLWTSSGSFYGAGAVSVGNYLLFAGETNTLMVADKKTGVLTDSYSLINGEVRCALVSAEGAVWFTTKSGYLYKAEIDSDGKLTKVDHVVLPYGSNCSPAVAGGKVYVTGGYDTDGFFAVYDTKLNKLASVETEGQMNTPTVSTAYEDTYAYFTQYGKPGKLFAARVTAGNQITITEIYEPTHSQYSMSNVIVGEDGTLYFGNDAGYLYAVKGKASGSGEPEPPVVKPEQPEVLPVTPAPNPSGTGTNKNTNQLGKAAPNRKATSLAAKKKTETKSSDEKITEALIAQAENAKTSLTVKNVPERLGADVFQVLAQYPQFRLILDCGTYTLSIRGKDVKHTNVGMNTRLIEKESTLTAEEAARLGNHQVLEFAQEGELPGHVTVVYQLPEQLEQSTLLYLYEPDNLEQADEAVIQKQYAMFTLEKGGEFILADAAEEDTQVEETSLKAEDLILPEENQKEGLPVWLKIMLGAMAGAIVGGGLTAAVVSSRSRKEKTWEQEDK